MDWLLPPGMQMGLPGATTIGFFALKLLYLIAFLLYVIFAFVVVRQIRLMKEGYQSPLDPLLVIISWAHFLVAVGVLVLAFLFL